MIRPCRAFIIGLAAARARRNADSRLTFSTSDQSSSDIRMTSPSRVIPALFTNMSSLPSFSTTVGTSASTCSASERSHGTTICPSPFSSGINSISARFLVPDSATFAPRSANALAMAEPIPPDAPVTSAVFPVRSNIIVPVVKLQTLDCRQKGVDIISRDQAGRFDLFINPLYHPAKHFAAKFDKLFYTSFGKIEHRFAPAHCSRHLGNQQTANLVGICNHISGDIGEKRDRWRHDIRFRKSFFHRFGSRLH